MLVREARRTFQAAGAEPQEAQPAQIGEPCPPRRKSTPQYGKQQEPLLSDSDPIHANSGDPNSGGDTISPRQQRTKRLKVLRPTT